MNLAIAESVFEIPATWTTASRSPFPAPGAEPLLSLRGVEAFIGGDRVLRGVDLDIEPGEVVALMGRGGAGKTSILKVITGRLPLRGGSLAFGGRPFARLSPGERA
ncbi:MAG: ATP-binding cassette domain-containing protein, partial [Opitutaceae bacterium]|nr:ATP-binding cassette domain-containing protein [Opitutaceae bacterium]